MVTSEYAMGIVAAVAFAVVLYKVVTSGAVSAELQNIVKRGPRCADVSGGGRGSDAARTGGSSRRSRPWCCPCW